MKNPKKTLLDLDRNPTLDELRTFFKENDWSAAAYMELDYDNMPDEITESLEYMKGMLDEHWETLSREMGLKSHSGYYGKDNPLIALRDNFEDLVSTGVLKLITEQPEKAAEILEDFMDDNGEFDGDADRLLHNAVETAMKTMSYEETAKIIQGYPAYEDFNHSKINNYRAKDFDKKWNHTRAKLDVVSMTDLEKEDNAKKGIADPLADTADTAITNIKQDSFWSAISDDDKNLLRLRMNGLTQNEIAKELGYKTHSAVTKRLQKLKETFESCV
jgi:hypothetical protein